MASKNNCEGPNKTKKLKVFSYVTETIERIILIKVKKA